MQLTGHCMAPRELASGQAKALQEGNVRPYPADLEVKAH